MKSDKAQLIKKLKDNWDKLKSKKTAAELTKEDLDLMASQASIFYRSIMDKPEDDGLEPYLSKQDAKIVKKWNDTGRKGHCPPVVIKWRKKK